MAAVTLYNLKNFKTKRLRKDGEGRIHQGSNNTHLVSSFSMAIHTKYLACPDAFQSQVVDTKMGSNSECTDEYCISLVFEVLS